MKKNPAMRVLPIAFLVACLMGVLSLSACSTDESARSEEVVHEDPKYVVQLFVDCEQNFLFSRYDVDVMVDGEEIGNIEHGSEATFELRLTRGQHELVFEKEGDSEPDGRTSFVVEYAGDKFSYEIRCTRNQIEVESIKEEAEDQSASDTEEEDDSDKQNPSGDDTAKEEESAKEEDPIESAEDEATVADEPIEEESSADPAESTEKEEAKTTSKKKKKKAKSSKYEYAYARLMSSYDLYYLIDLDEMTATYFGTNDSDSMVLPCTGDLENGLTVDYGDEDFQETLQFKTSGDDSVLILTDSDGFEWEYTKVDVADAEAVLASVE